MSVMVTVQDCTITMSCLHDCHHTFVISSLQECATIINWDTFHHFIIIKYSQLFLQESVQCIGAKFNYNNYYDSD